MNLRQALQTEFAQRKQRNPRYSLRAFARYLGTDHSTLSQIIRTRRNPSTRMISRFGKRLNLTPNAIVAACVRENAEAILRLARAPGFRANTRWIAIRSGIPIDSVNAAIHHLLYHGQLTMLSSNHWKITYA